MSAPASAPAARGRHRHTAVATISSILSFLLVATGLVVAAGPAAAAGDPWIASDRDDYPPGATVTLTGGNWSPGETVHVVVDDDQTRTWQRQVDVVADEAGQVRDVFTLPDWFVATYTVEATGPVSGTARTGFTDGNVTVTPSPANVTFTIGYTEHNGTGNTANNGCAGTGSAGSQLVSAAAPLSKGVGDKSSIRLTAPSAATSPSGWTFSHWVVGTETKAQASVCVPGNSGSVSVEAVFTGPSIAATTVAVQQSSAVYGGETTLRATLATASGPVAGKDVAFTLGGSTVGSAVTNASGVATLAGVSVDGFGAGTHSGAVSAAYAGDTSHATSSGTGALVVQKAPLTLKAGDASKTYGQPNPTLGHTVTGLVDGESAATALTENPSVATTATAGSGVGSYPITVNGGASANYEITRVPGTLTVTPAKLTVSADDKSMAYGNAVPELTSSVTGLVGDDTRGEAVVEEPTLATDATSRSPKGTYAITVTGGSASGNYTLDRVDGELTVGARAITVTADPQTKTYGEADPELTYRVTEGSLAEGDTLSGALVREAGADVGSRAITQGTLTAGPDYALRFEGAQLSITPRPITVTADPQTKVYGEDDPTLTHQVTAGNLVGDDQLSGSLSREDGTNVGSYVIGKGTLTAGPNYSLDFQGSALTITERPITVTAQDDSKTYGDEDPAFEALVTIGSLVGDDALTGALTREAGESVRDYEIRRGTLTAGSNYDLTFVPGTFTIAKRAITVTANDRTKVYGEDDPTLTYAITGGSLVGTDGLSGELARERGEDVGDYPITQGTLSAGDNYALDVVPGTLSITTRSVTVTADAATKVYGEADPTLGYKVTGGSLVAGDSFTGELERVAGENVGNYAIGEGSLSLGRNYDLSYVGADLVITKKALTVTAKDAERVYGDANPQFELDYDGFVDGEGPEVLDGQPAYDTVATRASVVGEYPVTVTGLTSANYDIKFDEGTLTVTARPVAVTAGGKTKVYGEADPELTYEVTAGNLVNGDTFTGELTRTAGSDVGSYTITQGSLALSDNYRLTFVGASLEITAKPLTVTTVDAERIYGDANPEFDVTYGDFAYDEGPAVLGGVLGFTTEATQASPVGSYDVTPGGLTSGNYALEFVAGKLTVTERPLTVTADDRTKVYGEELVLGDQAFKTEGLVNGDTVDSVSLSSAGAAATAGVGDDYKVEVSQATGERLGNYSISYQPGTLRVTPKGLTVTANDRTKVYGEELALGTKAFTYTGAVNGDQVTDVTLTSPGAAASATAGTHPIDVSDAQGTGLSNYAITYKPGTMWVHYAWNGFLQPINDTAHQVSSTLSKFRLGQTVPVKFVARDAKGVAVVMKPEPSFSYKKIGTCVGDTVTETPTTEAPTSGGTFRWDGSQYHYNWSTKGISQAGLYEVRANLGDGNTATKVNICLSK